MSWRIKEVPELKGFVVEWAEPGNYLLSRRNQIYRSTDLKPPFELIAEVEAPFWREVGSFSRLGQRLLRFSVTNAIPLTDGEIFVSFDKSVGVIRNGKYLHLQGLERPCRILRSGAAIDEAGNLFFGEYVSNDDRGPVNIYRHVPGTGTDSVEKVFTFPKNSIRHIHGIYFDVYDRSLVCLTGDADSECRMLRTRDGFKTIETVGEGDESWRAVSVLFAADTIYYGTDAEYRANTIYELDRATGDRKMVGEVSGTVFYSQQFMGEMFFATTAENAPSQTENVAAIWNVDAAGNLKEITIFAKDRWHATLFGFGTVYFPHVSSTSDELFFSLSATERDNRTFRIVSND